MTDQMKNRLADLVARQAAGEHMCCPRCGHDSMKDDILQNGLSRHVDNVYICPDCWVQEANLDVMNRELLLIQWAAFRPKRPENPYKNIEAEEAADLIEQEQISTLHDIFRLCQQDPENSMEYRARAFESCPGMTELWTQPFMATYETQTEPVVVQFKEMNGHDMYSINVLGGDD